MATPYTRHECREFIRHYLIAALWSSHDYRSQPDSDDYDPGVGEMMDDNYEPEDLDPQARTRVRSDCLSFLRQCIEQGIDLHAVGNNHEWSAIAEHGHDFWLTRCRHGAGFWDRGYGLVGEQLSDIACAMGDTNCVPYSSNTFGIE